MDIEDASMKSFHAEDMDCPICMDKFDLEGHTPKIFSCRHTVCVECVDSLITKNQCGGYIKCPLCTTDIQIRGNACDFETDKLKVKRIQNPQKRLEKEGQNTCKKHVHKPFTSVCMTCVKKLCKHCCAFHNQDCKHPKIIGLGDAFASASASLENLCKTFDGIKRSQIETNCIRADLLEKVRSRKDEIIHQLEVEVQRLENDIDFWYNGAIAKFTSMADIEIELAEAQDYIKTCNTAIFSKLSDIEPVIERNEVHKVYFQSTKVTLNLGEVIVTHHDTRNPHQTEHITGTIRPKGKKSDKLHEKYASVLECALSAISAMNYDNHVEDAGTNLVSSLVSCVSLYLETKSADTRLLKVVWKVLANLCFKFESCEQVFLCEDGIDLIYKTCAEVLQSEDYEILKHLMLIFVNVCSDPNLRKYVMKDNMLNMVIHLVEIMTHDVKHDAIRSLVYIVSDNHQWEAGSTFRDEIFEVVHKGVKESDYYRLKHIDKNLSTEVNFLSKYRFPVLQYWAMWTICNCLENDLKHYKSLLIKAKGRAAIITLLDHPESDNEVKQLAKNAMDLCRWDMPVAQTVKRQIRRPVSKHANSTQKR